MESTYDESINSNHEQVDLEDQENNNDDIGVGRSYECVFCKRGFNTAQALGGHMNIHRKDRVRNKAAKQQEIHTGPRFDQPLLQGDHHSDSYAISHDHNLMSYAAYFPGPNSSTTLPLLYGNNCHQYQQPLNPGYWSLGFAPKDLEMNQKEELDLELRLGYEA